MRSNLSVAGLGFGIMSGELQSLEQTFLTWLEHADFLTIGTAVSIALVVTLVSQLLARLASAIVVGFLRIFRVRVPKILKEALRDFARTVLIALAFLHVLHVLNAPEPFGRVLHLFLVSAIILHLFITAFGVIAEIIKGLTPKSAGVGSAWLVSVARGLLIVLAITSILQIWGINISTALAGFGVLGAGLAIAMKDFIQNLVAGLTNAGERRFRVGDWVEVDGNEGVIERIDLRSTRIMGFDRVPRFVPNSDLSNNVLQNKSRIDQWRISQTIPLVMEASDAQIEMVCQHLRRHIKESGEFVTDGTRTCLVLPVGMSASSVDIMVYVYANTSDWETWLDIKSRFLTATRSAVDAAGTSLAYPTSTVRLDRTDPPTSETKPES